MIKPFAQIPTSVLTDTRLSPLEKVLYGLILGKSNQEGYCWASNKTLSEWCNCSSRQVGYALDKLEELEYLERIFANKEFRTDRKIYPKVVVGSEAQFGGPPKHSSTNNTLSLKRKRADKKSDDFYPQWKPLSCTGTEHLEDDIVYKATNGLYDSKLLIKECELRWPNTPKDKTELYQKIIKKIKA